VDVIFTFAHESSILIHYSHLLSSFVIDCFVLLQFVETQMVSQFRELIVSQFFAQEFRHFLNFTFQILSIKNKKLVMINRSVYNLRYQSIYYTLHILVKYEMQIGVVTLVPGFEDVGEERRTHN
jgi:hypothetical protein